jgi:hypothetical protein
MYYAQWGVFHALTRLCIAALIFSIPHFNQNTVKAQGSYGILRSDDNGRSWMNVSNVRDIGPIGAIVITSNGYVFAGAASYTGDVKGLFRSTVAGSSWNKVSDIDVRALAVRGEDEIFAGGGDGVFRSNDGGAT